MGGSIRGTKLDGKPIEIFITNMINDCMDQGFEPLTLLFGPRYPNLGLKAEHRDLNRRIALYGDWGKTTVKEIIQQSLKRI